MEEIRITRVSALLAIISLLCVNIANGRHPYPPDADSVCNKIKDIVIYEDPLFYSSFPSVIKRPSGDYIVAFRRAPDRKIFGEKGTSMLIRTAIGNGIQRREK
jgi:hypothetical protein